MGLVDLGEAVDLESGEMFSSCLMSKINENTLADNSDGVPIELNQVLTKSAAGEIDFDKAYLKVICEECTQASDIQSLYNIFQNYKKGEISKFDKLQAIEAIISLQVPIEEVVQIKAVAQTQEVKAVQNTAQTTQIAQIDKAEVNPFNTSIEIVDSAQTVGPEGSMVTALKPVTPALNGSLTEDGEQYVPIASIANVLSGIEESVTIQHEQLETVKYSQLETIKHIEPINTAQPITQESVLPITQVPQAQTPQLQGEVPQVPKAQAEVKTEVPQVQPAQVPQVQVKTETAQVQTPQTPNVTENTKIDTDIAAGITASETVTAAQQPTQSVAVQVSSAIIENLEKIVKTIETVKVTETAQVSQAKFSTTITKTEITKFEVTLNPEHLGKVTVRLATDGVKLSVLIFTANDEVRNLLMARAQSVKVMVALSGVTVEKYEVVTQSQNQNYTVEQANETQRDILDDRQNNQNGQEGEKEQSQDEETEVNFAELIQTMGGGV